MLVTSVLLNLLSFGHVFAVAKGKTAGMSSLQANPIGDNLHQETATPDMRSESRAIITDQIGEPHGKAFSDLATASLKHRRISSIRLSGCGPGQRLSSFTLGWRDNHAGTEGDDLFTSQGVEVAGQTHNKLDLAFDEYVTDIYLSTYKAKVGKTVFATHHTRIGYARFITNKQHEVKCGSDPETDPTYWWRNTNPQLVLLYLSGSAGEGIDALVGHFIPVEDF